MSVYRFGRHDVRPESKVTQRLKPRRRVVKVGGAYYGKTEEQRRQLDALSAANEAMPPDPYAVALKEWGRGFSVGLFVGLVGSFLLYAAIHFH